jgi:hypothetical protein
MKIWDIETAKKEHQYSPRLAVAMKKLLPAKTPIVDLGCGKGTYLINYQCIGVEGTPEITEIADFDGPILTLDLSVPQLELCKFSGSNVICLEVAEHIPPEQEQIFLDNIFSIKPPSLILSWALKGQGGTGHHNEQDPAYVIPKIERRGYNLDCIGTEQLRYEGGKDLWWFQKSIYVFTKDCNKIHYSRPH